MTAWRRGVEQFDGRALRMERRVAHTSGNASDTVELEASGRSLDGSVAVSGRAGRLSKTLTSYQGGGQATTTSTAPDGTITVATYRHGRLESSAHAVLGTTTYTYDAFNRVASETRTVNGRSRATTYAYDAAGRLVSATDALGRKTAIEYDKMGRRTATVLPDGRRVAYTYAPTGELLKVSGAETYPQAYAYDHAGRLRTLADGRGSVTTWSYSADRGFLTSKTYADGSGVSYTYRPDGLPLTRRWARGVTTTYSYDNAGSLAGADNVREIARNFPDVIIH